YVIDPTRQPGFGAAKPRNFNVVLDDEAGASINYLDEQLNVHAATFPDLLPRDLLIRLDAQSGFQETLDIVMIAKTAGLLELRLQIHSGSGGLQYVQTTDALRIYKR